MQQFGINLRKIMEYILKNSIGYRINKVANNINKELNKILSKYDIAVEQRATLEIIKFEENANQKMIAQLLGKDKTTISRSLNALEKKGLIRRNEIQNDKRVNVIQLTPKAEQILQESQNDINEFRNHLCSALKPHEIVFLFNSLDKINQIV